MRYCRPLSFVLRQRFSVHSSASPLKRQTVSASERTVTPTPAAEYPTASARLWQSAAQRGWFASFSVKRIDCFVFSDATAASVGSGYCGGTMLLSATRVFFASWNEVTLYAPKDIGDFDCMNTLRWMGSDSAPDVNDGGSETFIVVQAVVRTVMRIANA